MGQIVNILVFVGCRVSHNHSTLLSYSGRSQGKNKHRDLAVCNPRKLYLNIRQQTRFGSVTPAMEFQYYEKTHNILLSLHMCFSIYTTHLIVRSFQYPLFFVTLNCCLDSQRFIYNSASVYEENKKGQIISGCEVKDAVFVFITDNRLLSYPRLHVSMTV